MGWTTAEFVNAFVSRDLGRKKSHASMRVLDGPHCRVLTQMSVSSGSPNDVDIYGIELLNNDGPNLIFLHPSNYYSHNYKTKRAMHLDDTQKMPSGVLRSSDPALLDSGIIEINEDYCLLEIGDKPYLMRRAYKMANENLEVPATLASGLPKWDTIEPLSKRVQTLAEALVLAKDPEGCVNIAGEYWGRLVDPTTVPVFDPELEKIISTGINPVDYGYQVDELVSESIAGNGGRYAYPKKSVVENPADKRSISYRADVKKFAEACTKLANYSPISWEGVTVKKDRYSYSSGNNVEADGTIICTTLGTFVSGNVKSADTFSNEFSAGLDWYKLEKRIERKRIST